MQASVTIPGRNVKLFAKALSALAKIGNEVVVEFGDGVSLRVPRALLESARRVSPRAKLPAPSFAFFSLPRLPC